MELWLDCVYVLSNEGANDALKVFVETLTT